MHGLDVYRQTVLDLLHIFDPEGIELRSRYGLRRREYHVLGPNFLWHMDGYNKLILFGFSIHGGIDGFSRKILWLELVTTNKNPTVIAYYFFKTIQ